MKAKIIDLFPLIFKDGSQRFTFLDARSKYFEKIYDPPLPHSQWDGAAIMALTGQGRLFILPGYRSGWSQAVNVPAPSYTIASSSCIVSMSPVNSSITTGNTGTNLNQPHPLPVPETSDKFPSAFPNEDMQYPLPIAVKDEITDPYIGQAILEYADKKESFYPDYPPANLKPGETELYKINWKIDIWKAWRASAGKQPLKESHDKQFYIVAEEDFKEYSKFCDSLKFLSIFPDYSCIIPQSRLLTYYMKMNRVEIPNVDLYGSTFYVLSDDMLLAFANWIEGNSAADY